MEAHATQTTSSSYMPASWPLCSQSSGASSLRATSLASRSSLRATSLALRSQPIYSWWMGLSWGGRRFLFLILRDSLSLFSSSLVLRKTVFLDWSLLFLSSLFYLFWLIVTSRCIILLLHPLPCSFRVSPSVSAFSLHLPESTILSSVGGCYRYDVDRP